MYRMDHKPAKCVHFTQTLSRPSTLNICFQYCITFSSLFYTKKTSLFCSGSGSAELTVRAWVTPCFLPLLGRFISCCQTSASVPANCIMSALAFWRIVFLSGSKQQFRAVSVLSPEHVFWIYIQKGDRAINRISSQGSLSSCLVNRVENREKEGFTTKIARNPLKFQGVNSLFPLFK